MECSICGKNVLFPKKIFDGALCKDCVAKLPTPNIELSVGMAKELIDFKGDTKNFRATTNLGKLHIDYGNGYFVAGEKVNKDGTTETPFVFSVLDLTDYSITFDIRMKKNGEPFTGSKKNTIIGDTTFRCSLNNPDVFLSIPLARGQIVKYYYTDKTHISWEEPMELKKFRIAFDQMVKKAFTDYEEKIKQQRAMQQEEMEETNELKLAMAVFFLEEGYTKAELRRQRNMLIKTFHPDSQKTNAQEYAQKINHYYEVLLRNAS